MKLQPFVVIFLLLLLAAAASPAAAQTPARPNILMIMVDDLAPVLGVYGGQAYTPHLDRLAAEGALFENAHVNAVSCNPSRISMIIGLRPASTGITSLSPEHCDWRTFLTDPASPGYQNYGPGISQIKTIFQHFRDNGYFIASAGKIFHNNDQILKESWDMAYTWDFWQGIGWPQDVPINALHEYFAETFVDWGAIDQLKKTTGEFYTEQDLPDYRVTQNALRIIAALPDDRPFFVNVGYLLPHLPWYVPQRLLDRYPLDRIELPPVLADDLADLPPEALALVWQEGKYHDQRYLFEQPQQWRAALAHYLAGVSYMDEQVGVVLAALEQRGLADNTIVLFWSDHGYHLGEKQHLQKHTLWEESTHIPLLVRMPGMIQAESRNAGARNAGARIAPPVGSVDLFPTLIELAGLAPPSDFPRDGRSLVPLLRNPKTPWPWPVVTTHGRWNTSQIDRAALRTAGWRYIHYDLDRSTSQSQEELYFHLTDPHEWYNLLSPRNGDPAPYRGVRIFLEQMLRGQNQPDRPPRAHSLARNYTGGGAARLRISGEDANFDYLLFNIETLPEQGRLYQSPDGVTRLAAITQPGVRLATDPGWATWLIYQPDPGVRADRFTFSVSDGRNQAVGQVDLSLTPPAAHPLVSPGRRWLSPTVIELMAP